MVTQAALVSPVVKKTAVVNVVCVEAVEMRTTKRMDPPGHGNDKQKKGPQERDEKSEKKKERKVPDDVAGLSEEEAGKPKKVGSPEGMEEERKSDENKSNTKVAPMDERIRVEFGNHDGLERRKRKSEEQKRLGEAFGTDDKYEQRKREEQQQAVAMELIRNNRKQQRARRFVNIGGTGNVDPTLKDVKEAMERDKASALLRVDEKLDPLNEYDLNDLREGLVACLRRFAGHQNANESTPIYLGAFDHLRRNCGPLVAYDAIVLQILVGQDIHVTLSEYFDWLRRTTFFKHGNKLRSGLGQGLEFKEDGTITISALLNQLSELRQADGASNSTHNLIDFLKGHRDELEILNGSTFSLPEYARKGPTYEPLSADSHSWQIKEPTEWPWRGPTYKPLSGVSDEERGPVNDKKKHVSSQTVGQSNGDDEPLLPT